MINVAESTNSSEPSNEIMISGRQHMVQIMKKQYEIGKNGVILSRLLFLASQNRFVFGILSTNSLKTQWLGRLARTFSSICATLPCTMLFNLRAV